MSSNYLQSELCGCSRCWTQSLPFDTSAACSASASTASLLTMSASAFQSPKTPPHAKSFTWSVPFMNMQLFPRNGQSFCHLMNNEWVHESFVNYDAGPAEMQHAGRESAGLHPGGGCPEGLGATRGLRRSTGRSSEDPGHGRESPAGWEQVERMRKIPPEENQQRNLTFSLIAPHSWGHVIWPHYELPMILCFPGPWHQSLVDQHGERAAGNKHLCICYWSLEFKG